MRYRVFFQYGDTDITEKDYLGILQALKYGSHIDGTTLPYYFITEERKVISLQKMTYIIPIKDEAKDAVVTPKTPTQLRQEQEREQANVPITLDDQLANEAVGK